MAIVPFAKDWRSRLHKRKEESATVIVLPIGPKDNEIWFEQDPAVGTILNGTDQTTTAVQEIDERVAGVNESIQKTNRALRRQKKRRTGLRSLKRGM